MCLSTVFKVVDGEPEEICGYVSNAIVGDGIVTFCDVMGVETVVEGAIERVDLVENKIFVAATNAGREATEASVALAS